MSNFIKIENFYNKRDLMFLNLDIYEITEVFVRGDKCTLRIKKPFVLGFKVLEVENVSYNEELKKFLNSDKGIVVYDRV
jgi:hypothetical protein